jgi:hypothetical protein
MRTGSAGSRQEKQSRHPQGKWNGGKKKPRRAGKVKCAAGKRGVDACGYGVGLFQASLPPDFRRRVIIHIFSSRARVAWYVCVSIVLCFLCRILSFLLCFAFLSSLYLSFLLFFFPLPSLPSTPPPITPVLSLTHSLRTLDSALFRNYVANSSLA